jgi:hypothetical protein
MEMAIIAMQRDQLSNPDAWHEWGGHMADAELVTTTGMPDAKLVFNCPVPTEGIAFVLVVHNQHTVACRVSFNEDTDFLISRFVKTQPAPKLAKIIEAV